jgi:hypothetical protein
MDNQSAKDQAMNDAQRRTHDGRPCQSGRRGFLKQLCAGALAASLPMASQQANAAAANPEAPVAVTGPVPEVTIAGRRIPRMIIGSNPIGGWSHQIHNMTLAMTDYFNLENTIDFLRRCEKAGLTAFICPFQDKTLKAVRTLWAEGSKMRIYFLGELGRDGKLSKDIMEYKPLWHVHHGNVTDALFRAGKQEQVHDFVKKVHDELGIPAGVSAHNPDVFKYIEDKGWDVDLYQCCLYYITRPKPEIRAKLGGAMLGEPFLDTDRDNMLKVIQQVKKPCLAFKILGAGWLCDSDDAVEDAFQYALSNIKKTDAIIVGMWPKYKDEITQNVQLLQRHGAVV